MNSARANMRAKNATKCTGCNDQDAIWILIDYDNIQLLCDSCMNEISSVEGEINLDFYSIFLGWAPIFEHINKNLKYLDEQYSFLLKEYSKFKKEAGKSEAIEALMREQRYIKIHHWSDGSVKSYSVGGVIAGHMQSSDGPKLASAILAILFPDEEFKE